VSAHCTVGNDCGNQCIKLTDELGDLLGLFEGLDVGDLLGLFEGLEVGYGIYDSTFTVSAHCTVGNRIAVISAKTYR
jgi:hypothetical protein